MGAAPPPRPVQDLASKTNANHLQISWSFRPVFLLPGQESRRRSQKGPGETFGASPSSFPQRDAGAKEWPDKVRIEPREPFHIRPGDPSGFKATLLYSADRYLGFELMSVMGDLGRPHFSAGRLMAQAEFPRIEASLHELQSAFQRALKG